MLRATFLRVSDAHAALRIARRLASASSAMLQVDRAPLLRARSMLQIGSTALVSVRAVLQSGRPAFVRTPAALLVTGSTLERSGCRYADRVVRDREAKSVVQTCSIGASSRIRRD